MKKRTLWERVFRGGKLRLTWLWEPRDLWIGLYWDWDKYGISLGNLTGIARTDLHLYFCLIPALPLRVSIRTEDRLVG